MSYKDNIADELKMNVDDWPHLFTKTHREVQVGLDQLTGEKLFHVEMTCIHCLVRYINGRDPRPADPCPARNKNTELDRLLS